MAWLMLAVMKSEAVVRTEVVLQGDAIEVAGDDHCFQVARDETDAPLRSAHAQRVERGGLRF